MVKIHLFSQNVNTFPKNNLQKAKASKKKAPCGKKPMEKGLRWGIVLGVGCSRSFMVCGVSPL